MALETKDLQDPTLRVTTASIADYLLALKNGSSLAEIPLVCIAASLFIPGSGKVVLVDRGTSYTESRWENYANYSSINWSGIQGTFGDILVMKGVASDTNKSITLIQNILELTDTGVNAKPFLLLKEGEVPAWKNVT